jgi:polysaccharide export outer membrane protein
VVEPVKLTTVLKGRRALRAGALANALPTLGSGDVLVIP